MSSLGPDGTFREERSARGGPPSNFAPLEGASSVSAAPLWMAFRDHYTRAKGRRQIDDISALFLTPCP